MVFFVCESCNETLKRNKVTCVDCNATFHGRDYFAHSTCISEAQKVEGSLYKGGDKKPSAQDVWNALVAQCGDEADTASPKIKALLPRLAALTNVPRNEKKFKNFVSNSLNVRDAATSQALWDLLAAKRDARAASSSTEDPAPAKRTRDPEEEREQQPPLEQPDPAASALESTIEAKLRARRSANNGNGAAAPPAAVARDPGKKEKKNADTEKKENNKKKTKDATGDADEVTEKKTKKKKKKKKAATEAADESADRPKKKKKKKTALW